MSGVGGVWQGQGIVSPLRLFSVATLCGLLCLPSLTFAAECRVHVDQLGPLYHAGAPFRDNGVVCAPGVASDNAITISGTVRTSDCGGVVRFAVLDVWQTSSDADGALYYGCATCRGDNARYADAGYYCRGKVKADVNGAFTFSTVRPGRYDDRPIVHIHVKVMEAGETGAEHVTQLYFADDISSAAMPSQARLMLTTQNTATIDIATPFAGEVNTDFFTPAQHPQPRLQPFHLQTTHIPFPHLSQHQQPQSPLKTAKFPPRWPKGAGARFITYWSLRWPSSSRLPFEYKGTVVEEYDESGCGI